MGYKLLSFSKLDVKTVAIFANQVRRGSERRWIEAQLAECMQHFLQHPEACAPQKRVVPYSPLQPAAPAFNSSLSKHENSAVIEFRASADRAAFVKQAAAREIIWLVKSLASAASLPLRSFSFNLLTGRSNIKWGQSSVWFIRGRKHWSVCSQKVYRWL